MTVGVKPGVDFKEFSSAHDWTSPVNLPLHDSANITQTYLTLDAFRATVQAVALLPTGTGISFDYAFAPETLSAKRQQIFKALSERVAAAGEPFKLFFTPEQMESELRRAGFKNIEQWDSAHLNELYFRDRSDGLRLSDARLGMLVTAWV